MQKLAVQATSGCIAGTLGARQVRIVPRCSSSYVLSTFVSNLGTSSAHHLRVLKSPCRSVGQFVSRSSNDLAGGPTMQLSAETASGGS